MPWWCRICFTCKCNYMVITKHRAHWLVLWLHSLLCARSHIVTKLRRKHPNQWCSHPAMLFCDKHWFLKYFELSDAVKQNIFTIVTDIDINTGYHDSPADFSPTQQIHYFGMLAQIYPFIALQDVQWMVAGTDEACPSFTLTNRITLCIYWW